MVSNDNPLTLGMQVVVRRAGMAQQPLVTGQAREDELCRRLGGEEIADLILDAFDHALKKTIAIKGMTQMQS